MEQRGADVLNIFSNKKRKQGQNRRKNRKAQSSVEYIFMVAMALALIIPGTILFQQYTKGTQKGIVSSQIYKIGNDLVDNAELMYSVGENSWQTLEISFPKEIKSMKIYTTNDGSELVLRHGTDYISDAVFFTKITLGNSTTSNCNQGCDVPINQGYTKIRVESLPGGKVIYNVLKE